MRLSPQRILTAALISAPIAANAGLVSTDGGLGVYDTVNNLTWTSNANLFATQASSYSGGAAALVSVVIADSGGVIHDTPHVFDPTGTYTLSASDFNTSAGTMDYWGARAWVNYLNATNYGGSNTWVLPTAVDTSSASGCGASCGNTPAQSSSQMAQLFYGGLGQVAGSSITTTHNANYSLFSNVQSSLYWSGTEYAAGLGYAWYFDTDNGSQSSFPKNIDLYALAVSPGQVSAVPLPASVWLMLSGFVGIGVIARQRHAA
jgi:hypothetical protein